MNLLFQFKQFFRPFPEVDSWAYNLWMWLYDISRKKKYPPDGPVELTFPMAFPLTIKYRKETEDDEIVNDFRAISRDIYWYHEPDFDYSVGVDKGEDSGSIGLSSRIYGISDEGVSGDDDERSGDSPDSNIRSS